MLKQCPVCDSEFESDNLNQVYCTDECRLENLRKKDRIRKRKEREEERIIRDREKQRIQQAKIKAREEAERKQQEEKERELFELRTKANEGDPQARMKLAKPFSAEYWEAYKDYEIENSLNYENKPIRYINGISVYADNFTEMVMLTIEEQGRIFSELVRK